jgi:hypothetical protein
MPPVRLPLSGDVAQTINPWTLLFNPIGSQLGLVNIDLGQSSDPQVEREVLAEVASYGKQIGRIQDALMVLVKRLEPEGGWSEQEQAAIDDLACLVREVGNVKRRHHR